MTPTIAQEALQKYFGYDSFRPLQLDIIERVYAGADSLALMPTGGGKSMCFQIPAVTMPGTAVVVSPLISLMKDQVDGLLANGIKAAYLNSSMGQADANAVANDFESGALKLLYVSPERLLSAGFFQFLQRSKVSLFAIDEAHCISAWGHDFRPEYTQLKTIKQGFSNVPILALTATADRLTRLDICEQLSIPQAKQFVASFDRPNLSLEVRPGRGRREQIVRFIRDRPEQAGIVYCLSRKQTENLAGKLREAGYNAAAYHAGLSAEVRSKVQADFINDRTLIVCATIAFGMGIDKSNVRWVIHYTMPKNLENYYQEIGRSGRDGSTADTLLFYSYNDYLTLQDMLSSNPNSEVPLAKLDRMKEYAEALACRRRILLNYFSEDSGENCGNCDICLNPPERFDGTIVAQKALSAVARLKQNVGMGTVIDVLRGSQNQTIRHNGYDQIKTYGAGRDMSVYDWNYYFGQLVNLGYVYPAHEDFNKLKLTPAAKRVLFEGEKVELVRFKTLKERKAAEEKQSKARVKSENPRLRDGLFDHLRELRKQLAREMGIPPYQIFPDRTLEEMAATKPTHELELARISGVGEYKLKRYGDVFIDAICAFQKIDRTSPRINSGNDIEVKPARSAPKTITESLRLFKQGLEIEEIATERRLTPATIVGHLAKSYQEGADFDVKRLVDSSIIERVAEIMTSLGDQKAPLSQLMQHFAEGEVSYNELRFARLYVQRNE
ncbi:MAG: DNA helicase RecQ [Bacteroidota bacterium]